MTEPASPQGSARARRPDIPVAVYRMYSAQGELLYVGQSALPQNRLMQHRLGADWVREVATITVAWFDSRKDATEAEMAAIKFEGPRFNLEHFMPRRDMPPKTGGVALSQWLADNAVTVRDFSVAIGVNPERIRRIVACKSNPNGHLPHLIERATKGGVPAAVWKRRPTGTQEVRP